MMAALVAASSIVCREACAGCVLDGRVTNLSRRYRNTILKSSSLSQYSRSRRRLCDESSGELLATGSSSNPQLSACAGSLIVGGKLGVRVDVMAAVSWLGLADETGDMRGLC